MTKFLQRVKRKLSGQAPLNSVPQMARTPQIRRIDTPPVPIRRNDPLMAFFLSTPGAVEIEKMHLNSPALEYLKKAGVRVAVPMISQGELVGLLSLGQRLSEQDYSHDDHQLLS